MLKNWRSLFIVNDTEDEKEKEEDQTLDDSIKIAETLLEELDDFSDIDDQIEQALSGELMEKEGVVDNTIIELLFAEVEKKNRDGFDYFEYKQSLKALDKMPMNEVTKYRSAFATASTMGVTLKVLLESASFYLEILEKENKKYSNTFEKQIKEKVGEKEEKIIQLKTTIEEKKTLIKKLTEEIYEHENQIKDLKYNVKDSKKEISLAQNTFKVTFNYLKAQFTEDITRMKEYLK
jgi:hypothetical protein